MHLPPRQFPFLVAALLTIPLIASCSSTPSTPSVFTKPSTNTHVERLTLIRSSQYQNQNTSEDAQSVFRILAKRHDELVTDQAGIYAAIDARLKELQVEASDQSKRRSGLTLLGASMAVASVALTAVNPAAHAAWISALGAGGGGLVAYQGVLAEEGLSSQYGRQRATAVRSAYVSALGDFNAADADSERAFASSNLKDYGDAVGRMAIAQGMEKAAVIADYGLEPNAAQIQSLTASMQQLVRQTRATGALVQKLQAQRYVDQTTTLVEKQQKTVDDAKAKVTAAQAAITQAAAGTDQAAKDKAKSDLESANTALATAQSALAAAQDQQKAAAELLQSLANPL